MAVRCTTTTRCRHTGYRRSRLTRPHRVGSGAGGRALHPPARGGMHSLRIASETDRSDRELCMRLSPIAGRRCRQRLVRYFHHLPGDDLRILQLVFVQLGAQAADDAPDRLQPLRAPHGAPPRCRRRKALRRPRRSATDRARRPARDARMTSDIGCRSVPVPSVSPSFQVTIPTACPSPCLIAWCAATFAAPRLASGHAKQSFFDDPEGSDCMGDCIPSLSHAEQNGLQNTVFEHKPDGKWPMGMARGYKQVDGQWITIEVRTISGARRS